MERKQQPSHSIKDVAGFNQGWVFTNNKWEGEVKMGHKAKPIKPFLRQNKKGVFQYATEGRAEQSNVSRTYKPCLTPGSRCCPARGQQQAPNLGVLSNLHWKASLFDYVTRPALNWIRHLKLDSVNIHTPPSPPQPQHARESLAWECPGILQTLLREKIPVLECQVSEKCVNKSSVWLCLHLGCRELSCPGGSRGLLLG